jgi:hypothetical protein
MADMTPFLAATLLASVLIVETPPDRGQMTELSKSFLRDSAELPMDIAVTTVVKDASGKQKRNATSTVRLLFRGYNAQAGRWSFHANSGLMARRILYDSMGGSLAVFDAFTSIAPRPEGELRIVVEGGEAGAPFVVRVTDPKCTVFEMKGSYPYPNRSCNMSTFHVKRDAAGALAIDHFTLDILRLPASGKTPYLGYGTIRKVHVEGEVQEVRVAADTKPFLIPKRVITTVETDKGMLVVTNAYTLKAEPAKKK